MAWCEPKGCGPWLCLLAVWHGCGLLWGRGLLEGHGLLLLLLLLHKGLRCQRRGKGLLLRRQRLLLLVLGVVC